jgi:hypothetical protein
MLLLSSGRWYDAGPTHQNPEQGSMPCTVAGVADETLTALWQSPRDGAGEDQTAALSERRRAVASASALAG